MLAYRLVGAAAGAEDVSQEVFLQICTKLGQFREGGNFLGWVYRIVVNKAHDYRRARDPQAVEILDLAAPADFHPARQEQLRRVMEAMRELTEKERAALVLTDIEGLTSQEAARVLGCLAISVRTRASHARAKLRRVLSRYYPELREGA
jgi:RNA polymerase sigma-70 factor (ECF subfamily)